MKDANVSESEQRIGTTVRKRCPDCSELVHIDARTCRFCRFNFETGMSSDGAQLVEVEEDVDGAEPARKGTSLRYELFVFAAFLVTLLVVISVVTGNVGWIIVLGVVVHVDVRPSARPDRVVSRRSTDSWQSRKPHLVGKGGEAFELVLIEVWPRLDGSVPVPPFP